MKVETPSKINLSITMIEPAWRPMVSFASCIVLEKDLVSKTTFDTKKSY